MTAEEIAEVEELVNKEIQAALPVDYRCYEHGGCKEERCNGTVW